jgi:hypothetical protein
VASNGNDDWRLTGHWLGGDALSSVKKAVTIRMKSGALIAGDGPFTEIKKRLGGALYLEARDLNSPQPTTVTDSSCRHWFDELSSFSRERRRIL